MAFVNQSLSVYHVRPQHRNEEVRELFPADFGGVMICDRGRSYDAAKLEGGAQQKCLAHLRRAATNIVHDAIMRPDSMRDSVWPRPPTEKYALRPLVSNRSGLSYRRPSDARSCQSSA